MEDREARVEAAIDETTRLRTQVDHLAALRAQETERLLDQTRKGRRLLHEIRGDIQYVVSTLEMIQAEGDMPMPHQQEIEQAIDWAKSVATMASDLHSLVRGLEPDL